MAIEEDYNPIGCDHKLKKGKYKGLNSWQFLSQSAGSGGDIYFEHNVSVCRLCGEIKVSGFEQKDGILHKYDQEFSIHHPSAVKAIVKNANFMNGCNVLETEYE